MFNNLYVHVHTEEDDYRDKPVEGAVVYYTMPDGRELWYKELSEEEMIELPYSEIERLYEGCHLFLTNCTFSEDHAIVKGTPRILSNISFGGVTCGIYKKYDSPEYDRQCDSII